MMHSKTEQNKYLRELGFRFSTINFVRRTEAIKQFQNLVGLLPDGKYGLKTSFAMQQVIKDGGRVSPNFRFMEFQCKCAGRYKSCRGIKLDKKLVDALEKIRSDYYPDGLQIVSAYRCEGRNKLIGGAKKSQHVLGKAADIPQRVNHRSEFPSVIRGIGYDGKTKLVRHVDVRSGAKVKWVY